MSRQITNVIFYYDKTQWKCLLKKTLIDTETFTRLSRRNKSKKIYIIKNVEVLTKQVQNYTATCRL